MFRRLVVCVRTATYAEGFESFREDLSNLRAVTGLASAFTVDDKEA